MNFFVYIKENSIIPVKNYVYVWIYYYERQKFVHEYKINFDMFRYSQV